MIKKNLHLTSHLSELTMDEDLFYCNAEIFRKVDPKPPTEEKGLQSSDRRATAVAAVCLGVLCVLLLVGLICLGVYCESAGSRASYDLVNLTERLQTCENMSSSLSVGTDLLKQELQSLRGQVARITFCPDGWVVFGPSCYDFSNALRSWDRSREECKKSGADLVIINTAEEQEFIYKFSKSTYWIGMSDRDSEGNWKWVDGSPVSTTYWSVTQPDNGAGRLGEEDCGTFDTAKTADKNWNDLNCHSNLRWICEKRSLVFIEK